MEEEGPFASISNFCRPAASQEAKFRCPLFWQPEDFPDSYLDQLSSSPEPTPFEPAGIVMVSPPALASTSFRQSEEGDMVVHPPPEHHKRSHLSSSEDELCTKGVRNRFDGSKKARVSAGGLDDEANPMKIRVPIEVFDGETLPVGVTEEIVVEPPANKGVHSAADEVIVVEDSEDSGVEMDNLNWNKDSHGEINLKQKNCDLMKGGVSQEGGLLDFQSILNVIVADHDTDGACDEDVDFLETAKRRGLTFPLPRWWPPEEEEGGDRW